MAQTNAQRRAAQRRLARELHSEAGFRKSEIGAKARHAAAIGTSNPADLRADLEERAFRRAVSQLENRSRFNPDAVEVRIKGGVIVTGEDLPDGSTILGESYYPTAKLKNGVITLPDGTIVHVGKAKVTQIRGMSNSQLHKAIQTTGDEWRKLAKRGSSKGFVNHWLYH